MLSPWSLAFVSNYGKYELHNMSNAEQKSWQDLRLTLFSKVIKLISARNKGINCTLAIEPSPLTPSQHRIARWFYKNSNIIIRGEANLNIQTPWRQSDNNNNNDKRYNKKAIDWSIIMARGHQWSREQWMSLEVRIANESMNRSHWWLKSISATKCIGPSFTNKMNYFNICIV